MDSFISFNEKLKLNNLRQRTKRARCKSQLAVCIIVVFLMFLSISNSEADGIELSSSVMAGTIGSNRNKARLRECPNNKVVVGMRVEDRNNADGNNGQNHAAGIIWDFDLKCAEVTIVNNRAVIRPDRQYTNFNYPHFTRVGSRGDGVKHEANCPANTVAYQMGGDTFNTKGHPWASSIHLRCRSLIVRGGQIFVNSLSRRTTVVAGDDENNRRSGFDGFYCGTSSDLLITGYRPQIGGEGYDGINVSCGRMTVKKGVIATMDPVSPPAECTTTSVHQLDAFSYAAAIGPGASGVPSLSYTAPSGNSRMMYAVLTIERDHSPFSNGRGDNFASSVAINPNVSNSPQLNYGGVAMTPHYYFSRASGRGGRSDPRQAEISIEYFTYTLAEDNIPSGNQSFTFGSGFSLPKSEGDEATLMAATFANVHAIEGIHQAYDESNPFFTSRATSPTSSGTQPLGTTSADNMLVSVGVSTDAEPLQTGANWQRKAQLQVENTRGGFSTDSGLTLGPYSENDGITTLIQTITGNTRNQTTVVSSASSNISIVAQMASRLVAIGCDHGDAPVTYGSPTHTQDMSVFLGTSYGDADAGAQPTGNANGDDNDGIDDEDGITLPAFTQGETATITAIVNGAGGYLQGWIDFNGNQTFDANEQIVTNIQDGSPDDIDNSVNGRISIAVNVPATAITTPTYARFRWSTTQNLDAIIPVKNGETEDYPLIIAEAVSCSINALPTSTYTTASLAANYHSLSSATRLYEAAFSNSDWTGHLYAYDLETANNEGTVKNEKWDAATVIGRAGRSIFTYNSTLATNRGKAFTWANLNTAQQNALKAGDSTAIAQKRLAWLQGSASDEGGLLRTRSSILGDIVRSSPLYKGHLTNYGYAYLAGAESSSYTAFLTNKRNDAEKVVFVGANDGALHAFNANDGSELFAYIPNEVFPNLANVSNPNYGCKTAGCLPHESFVDGPLSLGDAYFNNRWHTVLLGTLGKGGKGVFALDVTDSNSFSASDVLWELSVTQAPSNASDFANHMGNSLPAASVVRLPNNEWAAIIANGYDSANHQAVLFIVNIETGVLIKQINTGMGSAAQKNGLSTPTAIDSNADGTVDTIYAGDLLGNLWAFDVSSETVASWGIKHGTKPLFTACEDNSSPCTQPQPITAAPQVGRGAAGGLMVYVGTGRYAGVEDNAPFNGTHITQSLYGIQDAGTGVGNAVTTKSSLVTQTILHETTQGGFNLRVTSDNPVNDATKKGWHMNLLSPASSAEGERVIAQALLRGGRIIFTTLIPDESQCAYAGSSWLMELDAMTGSRLGTIPFDTNGDKRFNSTDNVSYQGNETIISGIQKENIGLAVGSPTVLSNTSKIEGKHISGTSGKAMFRESASRLSGRISWQKLR